MEGALLGQLGDAAHPPSAFGGAHGMKELRPGA